MVWKFCEKAQFPHSFGQCSVWCLKSKYHKYTSWQNILKSNSVFYNNETLNMNLTLHKKCPYSEFFWSLFSRIRTECIDKDAPYLSIFNQNAWNYGPEKPRKRTFFKQCHIFGTQRQRHIKEPVKHIWWSLFVCQSLKIRHYIKRNLEIWSKA